MKKPSDGRTDRRAISYSALSI